MKSSMLAILSSATATAQLTVAYVEAHGEAMWGEFKDSNQRDWGSEDARRFMVFRSNMLQAAEFQRLNPLASFGPTSLADLTDAEYEQRLGSRSKQHDSGRATGTSLFSTQELALATASSIDWREHGAVSPVRDQGQCGGCWAFSAMGGIEGQWAAAGNALVPLSPQQLIDCDMVDDGCFGGTIDHALKFLLQSRGGAAVSWEAYPFTRHDSQYPPRGNCTDSGEIVGATISDWKFVGIKDESQMAAWVLQHGPLSVAVDASGAWKHYTGGIMTDCACLGPCSLTHSVLIVGYGPDSGTDYWLLKNSYGPSWGESGFVRMQRGSNLCLVANTPSSSIVPGSSAASRVGLLV